MGCWGVAVEESAYYSGLASLLTEAGKKLKPKVRCLMGLPGLGAGFPDGDLSPESNSIKSNPLSSLQGHAERAPGGSSALKAELQSELDVPFALRAQDLAELGAVEVHRRAVEDRSDVRNGSSTIIRS